MDNEYLYNGETVDYHNLSAFLLAQGKKQIIPYDKYDESDKKIERDGNNIKKIMWRVTYSGGWGLGYSSFIIYKPNQKHCWTVRFFDDPSPGEKSFYDRGHDYDYSDKGFVVDYIGGEIAVLSSSKLKNIIHYAFYYGLDNIVNDVQNEEINSLSSEEEEINFLSLSEDEELVVDRK